MASPRKECDPNYRKEETDLSSAHFNPRTALYSSDATIPCPDIRLFNNLAEYESAMKKKTGRQTDSSSAPSSSGRDKTCDYSHGLGYQVPTTSTGFSPHHSISRESANVECSPQESGGTSTSRSPDSAIGFQHYKHSTTIEHSNDSSSPSSSSRAYSYNSPYVRDPEYLEKKGLREEDCARYQIYRRETKTEQSLRPPTQCRKQSEREAKTDSPQFIQTAAVVGGAKGAWSYDQVTKCVKKTEEANKKPELRGFEVVSHTSLFRDESRNVFTRMDEYASAKAGPLHVLYRCMKEKLQARVWTRSAVSVRGICKGYIVAFDKHSNLAMMDVDEYYRNPTMKGIRLKSKKKLADRHFEAPLPCEAVWLGLRKEKLAQRHLNQVFIRGDNVVCVSIVQDWS